MFGNDWAVQTVTRPRTRAFEPLCSKGMSIPSYRETMSIAVPELTDPHPRQANIERPHFLNGSLKSAINVLTMMWLICINEIGSHTTMSCNPQVSRTIRPQLIHTHRHIPFNNDIQSRAQHDAVSDHLHPMLQLPRTLFSNLHFSAWFSHWSPR